MAKPHENHREDVAGRANVEDTPELLAYYNDLDKLSAGALWTVANKIEPWEPKSQSVPVVWRYRELRDHVLRSIDLVTPEKAGRRVIYLNNPGRSDVAAAGGWIYAGLQVMKPGEVAHAHRQMAQPWGGRRRHGLPVAGRSGHPLRQRDGGQFLRGPPRPIAGRGLCGG